MNFQHRSIFLLGYQPGTWIEPKSHRFRLFALHGSQSLTLDEPASKYSLVILARDDSWYLVICTKQTIPIALEYMSVIVHVRNLYAASCLWLLIRQGEAQIECPNYPRSSMLSISASTYISRTGHRIFDSLLHQSIEHVKRR